MMKVWRQVGHVVLILAAGLLCCLIGAFFLSLAIHFVLLWTDRFNWLEGPKRGP